MENTNNTDTGVATANNENANAESVKRETSNKDGLKIAFCGANFEAMPPLPGNVIGVGFDVDGHILNTEAYAYPAWYQGLLDFFANDEVAKTNVGNLISPDKEGGKDYFVSHFMGHSHKEICDEINTNIAPHNQMTLETFRKDLLPDIDDKIADAVTPDYVFPGIEELFEDLMKLQKAGEIKVFFISGSAVKRLKTSFRNSGMDRFIDDFDAQVFSGENYTNKNEVLRQLSGGDASRIIYSGDGYGDAKACKNVVNGEDVYFIGKSEGGHCPDDHYEKLSACGADVMTRTGFELRDAILDRIRFLQSRDNRENAFNHNISGDLNDNVKSQPLSVGNVSTVLNQKQHY